MAEVEQQGLADELAASARGRFVRWDGKLWREIVDGPAAQLATALDPRAVNVLASYLRLCCEGIGLGYLFPHAAGRESFFTLAFTRLVPKLLPALPLERQAEVLAALWNVGENLESAPAWLRRIFHRVCRDLDSLADLEGLVDRVSRVALAPPDKKLADAARPVWINLADEDRRFLPGKLHFVAPTVLCVHDRQRSVPGRDPVTLGIWLADQPLVLGPMACSGADLAQPAADDLWKKMEAADVRCREPHAVICNDWRGGATLIASQLVVGVVPG